MSYITRPSFNRSIAIAALSIGCLLPAVAHAQVSYTLLGDANLDGSVNGSDFAILATNFNNVVSGWDAGDFNYDGSANGSDFATLAANFNAGANQSDGLSAIDAFAAANGLQSEIPEPATASLLAIATLGLLRRRRVNI